MFHDAVDAGRAQAPADAGLEAQVVSGSPPLPLDELFQRLSHLHLEDAADMERQEARCVEGRLFKSSSFLPEHPRQARECAFTRLLAGRSLLKTTAIARDPLDIVRDLEMPSDTSTYL